MAAADGSRRGLGSMGLMGGDMSVNMGDDDAYSGTQQQHTVAVLDSDSGRWWLMAAGGAWGAWD